MVDYKIKRLMYDITRFMIKLVWHFTERVVVVKKLGILFLALWALGIRPALADNQALLEAAYQVVDDEFLGNVPMAEFAVWTMQGLQTMDKNLRVADDSSRVTVYYKSKVYKSLMKPDYFDNNKQAWAKLTLKILKAAVKVSPAIKQKDFEAVDRMLAYAVARLDKNSKYYSNLLQDEGKLSKFSREYAARMLSGRVLYIKLAALTKFSAANITQSIIQYRDVAEGIILDLRGCYGGSLQGAIDVADLFLDEGIIVSTKGRKPDSAVYYKAHEDLLVKNVPMVVLVDGKTASAAEALAAALQEQGMAAVLGSGTFGKGTVQNVIELPDHNEMLLTNAYYFTPAGNPLDKIGVKPDICLFRARDTDNLMTILTRKEPDTCLPENRAERRVDLDIAEDLLISRIDANQAMAAQK